MIRPCVQKCPRNDWRGKFYWVQPRDSGPDVVRGPGRVSTTPNLLSPILGVEPAQRSEIAVDREAFRALRELLSPRPPPVAAAGMK